MSKIIELPEVSASTIGNVIGSLFRAMETGNSHPSTAPLTVKRIDGGFVIDAHIAIRDEFGSFVKSHDEFAVVPVTYVIRAEEVAPTFRPTIVPTIDDEDDCSERGCSCGASDEDDDIDDPVSFLKKLMAKVNSSPRDSDPSTPDEDDEEADLYNAALGAFIDRVSESRSKRVVPAIIANSYSDAQEIAKDLRDPERVGSYRARMVEEDFLRGGVAIAGTLVTHIAVSNMGDNFEAETKIRGMTLGEVLIESHAGIPSKFMAQLLSRGARVSLV